MKNTIFTRMQNNPDIEMTPPNATPAKKKYSATNFIHIIHKACQIVSAFSNQCHCSITVSALIFLTLTANITIFFVVMPLHRVYSTFLNPSKSLLPYCCDLLTKRSHTLCFMILPAGVKHDPLSRATHYTATLRGLGMVCSPQHLAPAVVRPHTHTPV